MVKRSITIGTVNMPANMTVRIHKNTVDCQTTRDLDPLDFLAELAAHADNLGIRGDSAASTLRAQGRSMFLRAPGG